jgi:hypothetical protein
VAGRASKSGRSKGQIVVLFVLAIFVFTGMVALVIDISWYWVNSLRVQRAADAAALAGVVQLPGNPSGANGAFALARAEAKKNGYDDALAAVVLTPAQDPPITGRRLVVTISAPVDMFFMRIFGIPQINATRTARAEFVLPVPMGSPQQWYGVGTFDAVKSTQAPDVPGPTDETGFRMRGAGAAGTPAGNWTTPANADNTVNSSFAISTIANGSSQQWGNFGLQGGAGAIPTGAVIEGIEVRYRARITGSGGSTSNCQLVTQLSWDGGGSWTTATAAGTQALTTSEVVYTKGSPSSLAAWPRSAGTWAYASFTDGSFRVRLTWNKVNCGANRTASVNTLQVQVTYHSMVPGPITYSADPDKPLPIPAGETTQPTSQGFWGAIFTGGGARRNGDRYSPNWTYGGSAVANPEHIEEGYDYTVEIRGPNGRVHVFDPIFCATGSNPAGSGNYGAGDHWTELPSGGITNAPVTTEFSLWNTNGTLIDKTNDTLVGVPLTYVSRASDQSGNFDDPNNGGPGAGDIPTGGAITDCATDSAHNQWVQLAAGLPVGTYRVNVNTAMPANDQTAAENLWSLYVGNDGASQARVYGDAKMAAYSNLTGAAATQSFFLAQVGPEHAGKTMQIELFDPGDVAGDATLRIKSPDGNVYSNATFSYTTDAQCNSGNSDVCSATGRTSIRTAIGGSSSFDNTVITINIPLPSTYGSVGLTPPGVPNNEAGWWKIEYTVGAANDTTTWQVTILGNPVHLIVP